MPLSARGLALAALAEWRQSARFADVIIQDLLGRSSLGGADRAFALELFYGMLRNLRLLDFWIDQLREGKLEAGARDLLRLGLYQLFVLHTPEHAALNETVKLSGPRQRGLINGVLRSAQRQRDSLGEKAKRASVGIRYSHPDFLVERWNEEFGPETTENLGQWNNQPAPIYARLNLLKTSRAEFDRRFPDARPLPRFDDFVEFDRLPPAIEEGLFYVQDPSTSLAVRLLDAQPGETVLDACAAPGGKSAFIAQQMQNEGRLVAGDRDASRLARLRENLGRLGVSIAETQQTDWTKSDAEKSARFDRILLDAPCSNTGVMRRRVDVRWRLQPADFPRMQLQQLLLARALVPLLKPGGTFVYSTCSLERDENEEVVAKIAAAFPELKLVEQSSITPFRDGFDGAFAARFEKIR